MGCVATSDVGAGGNWVNGIWELSGISNPRLFQNRKFKQGERRAHERREMGTTHARTDVLNETH